MNASCLPDDNLIFAWDRPESAASLRERLRVADDAEWHRLAAWMMREAKVSEVWPFLTLRQVAASFERLAPLLGRRRDLWTYLMRTAHELGRV